MKHQFHNLDLSHHQQIAIVELWELSDVRVADVIQTALENGKKVSFGWDNYHDCLAMSLTPKNKEHMFYGYVVSLKHDDFETLVKILHWLERGAWNELDPPVAKEGRHSW